MATLLAAAITGLAVAVSYDAPCPALASAVGAPATTKAYRYHCYGAPTVLTLVDVVKPTPADSEIVVKVEAVSVNPLDWHYLRGKPYLMRMSSGMGAPTDHRIGADFAGTVDAVGAKVTRFKAGDRVFGIGDGTFAEFMTIRESRSVATIPDSISLEQASAVGVAALTALQAVRDKGQVKAGQRVLINGASGGVGSFAVQIAKSYGAHVTGVASTRNVELVKSLGADTVIDYTKDDFTKGAQPYDVIIDMVSNHSVRTLATAMTPQGICVIVGGTNDNRWLGPGIQSLKAIVFSPIVKPTFITLLSTSNAADVAVLRDLLQAGKIRSVIDRRYAFAELPAAVEYLETGRARGKVLVSMTPSR